MELSPSYELLSSKPLTGNNKKDTVMVEVLLQYSRKSKMDYGILS